MSKLEKKIRVATNRIDSKTVESIEQSSNGCLFWTTDEELTLVDQKTNQTIVQQLGASIPVDLQFVEEFFAKLGRSFDATLLRFKPIANPYSQFL